MASFNRLGESCDIPERHHRVVEHYCGWCYTTREGFTVGPFKTPSEAEEALHYFLRYATQEPPAVVRLLKLYEPNKIVPFLKTVLEPRP